jgi:hypothetical protein
MDQAVKHITLRDSESTEDKEIPQQHSIDWTLSEIKLFGNSL